MTFAEELARKREEMKQQKPVIREPKMTVVQEDPDEETKDEVPPYNELDYKMYVTRCK